MSPACCLEGDRTDKRGVSDPSPWLPRDGGNEAQRPSRGCGCTAVVAPCLRPRAGARPAPIASLRKCGRSVPSRVLVGGGACAPWVEGRWADPGPRAALHAPRPPTCFARQLPGVRPRGPGASCRPHPPDLGRLRGWRAGTVAAGVAGGPQEVPREEPSSPRAFEEGALVDGVARSQAPFGGS